MQSKPKTSNRGSYDLGDQPLWKNSRKFSLSLFAISFFLWLLVSARVAGELEITPTELILKQEGCGLLRQYGVHTVPNETPATCKTRVPFRPNLLGTGGRIYVDDEPIRRADSQLVAILPPLTDRPWTTDQKTWIQIWGIFTVVMVLVFLAAVFVTRGSQDERP